MHMLFILFYVNMQQCPTHSHMLRMYRRCVDGYCSLYIMHKHAYIEYNTYRACPDPAAAAVPPCTAIAHMFMRICFAGACWYVGFAMLRACASAPSQCATHANNDQRINWCARCFARRKYTHYSVPLNVHTYICRYLYKYMKVHGACVWPWVLVCI